MLALVNAGREERAAQKEITLCIRTGRLYFARVHCGTLNKVDSTLCYEKDGIRTLPVSEQALTDQEAAINPL